MGPHWRAPSYEENSQIFPAIRCEGYDRDLPPRNQEVPTFDPDHPRVGGKSGSPGCQIHARRLRPYVVNE